MAPPDISAILVADGETDLATVVDALCAQTLPATRYEILVIETRAGPAAQALEARRDRVRIVRQPGAAPAAAMNLAAFASVSPRLVFLPQQHPARPTFLAEILRAHEANAKEGDVVFGAVTSDPAQPQASLTRLMQAAPLAGWREPDCPISFKRALITQHGLFDAAFDDGWERVELLWRLRGRRIRLVHAPQAAVQLGASPSVADLLARAERQGRFHARLACKHPGAMMDAYAQIADAMILARRASETPSDLAEALCVQRARGVAAEWVKLGET